MVLVTAIICWNKFSKEIWYRFVENNCIMGETISNKVMEVYFPSLPLSTLGEQRWTNQHVGFLDGLFRVLFPGMHEKQGHQTKYSVLLSWDSSQSHVGIPDRGVSTSRTVSRVLIFPVRRTWFSCLNSAVRATGDVLGYSSWLSALSRRAQVYNRSSAIINRHTSVP